MGVHQCFSPTPPGILGDHGTKNHSKTKVFPQTKTVFSWCFPTFLMIPNHPKQRFSHSKPRFFFIKTTQIKIGFLMVNRVPQGKLPSTSLSSLRRTFRISTKGRLLFQSGFGTPNASDFCHRKNRGGFSVEEEISRQKFFGSLCRFWKKT